jgi:hypothetical protein
MRRLLCLLFISVAALAAMTVPAGAASATAPHLTYWGGALITNVRVVVVVWGPGSYTTQVTGTKTPNVPSFVATLTKSSYVDWLSEYNAGTQHIGRGTYVGRYTIRPAPKNNGSTVDDARNIEPELLAQIRAARLPAPDRNTLYVLFTRSGQRVTMRGSDSVTGFCAYHSALRFSGHPNVRYAVIPATASGAQCGTSRGFGNITSAASHEIAESITDPDVGLATRLGKPLGWYDARNGEIADICEDGPTASLTGSGGTRYVVQRLWSNRRRRCVWN